MTKYFGALAFGLVLMLGSAANADDKGKLSNPHEGKCPVSDKDINPKVTAEVGGKKYAFCCAKCMAKFKESPEKFLKKDAK